ncbi:Hsk1-interacting molecule 1 [Smittium culicis]|uniref:Hsk1-interacting molecule 1 n=1 Tax=Smittium culicis TaxID=133412 RepID=A0A1R1YGP0_9FUNG|nr:Hsk1-interacting molecule 1 [Smittium culicis]
MANRKLFFQTSIAQRLDNSLNKQQEYSISTDNPNKNSSIYPSLILQNSSLFDSQNINSLHNFEPTPSQNQMIPIDPNASTTTTPTHQNFNFTNPKIPEPYTPKNSAPQYSSKNPVSYTPRNTANYFPDSHPQKNASPYPPIKTQNPSLNNQKLLSPQSATPAKSNKDIQRAKLHEWVVAYRHAFPSFHFYFDDVPDTFKKALSASSVESFFSVNEVTHVIISDEAALSISKGRLSAFSNVVNASMKFNLKIWSVDKLQNRILKFLLPSHQSQSLKNECVLGKRNLSEVIQAEKLSTNGSNLTNGSNGINFYYFKHNYILTEDSSYMFKPILMNDYKTPESGCVYPWPKLYYVPKGRCPFIRYDQSTSSKDTDSDSEKEEAHINDSQSDSDSSDNSLTPRKKKKIDHQDHSAIAEVMGNDRSINDKNKDLLRAIGSTVIVDSIASGANATPFITSTSTINRQIIPMDRISQKTLVSSIQKNRVDQLSRLEQAISPEKFYSNFSQIANKLSNDNPPLISNSRPSNSLTQTNNSCTNLSDRKLKHAARFRTPNTAPTSQTKKKTIPSRQPAASRPGYCENCKVKYEDMYDHVQSSSHRAFANTASNWTDLDDLLSTIQRKPLYPPSIEGLIPASGTFINQKFTTESVGNSNFINYSSIASRGTIHKMPSCSNLPGFNTPINRLVNRTIGAHNNINGTLDNPITIFESSARSSSDNGPHDSNNSNNNRNANSYQQPLTPRASCLSRMMGATPSWETHLANNSQTPSFNNTNYQSNLEFSRLTPIPLYNTPANKYQNSKSTLSCTRTVSTNSANFLIPSLDWYKNSNSANRNQERHILNNELHNNNSTYETPNDASINNVDSSMSNTAVNSRHLNPSNVVLSNSNLSLSYQTPTKAQLGYKTQPNQQHLNYQNNNLSIVQQTKSWSSTGDNLINFANSGTANWAPGFSPSVAKIIENNESVYKKSTLELDVDRSTSY